MDLSVKKTILFLLILFLQASFVQARPNWLRNIFKKSRKNPPAIETVSRQGKLRLKGVRVAPPSSAEIEKWVLKNPIPTDERLYFEDGNISMRESLEVSFRYAKVMEEFKSFKKEADIFLYYNSKPLEFRPKSLEERRQIMEKSTQLKIKIRSLTKIVRNNASLTFALDYINMLSEKIVPELKGTQVQKSKEAERSDRVFNKMEFFLERPNVFFHKNINIEEFYAQIPNYTPRGLKIAFVNDRKLLLKRISHAHKRGTFLQGNEVDVYEESRAFLQAVSSGENYDVVIVDLVMPNGGGYYINYELRQKKFNGVLLALSAYEETEELGRELFQKGFDGMIGFMPGLELVYGWKQYLSESLAIYFYHRDKNGWK